MILFLGDVDALSVLCLSSENLIAILVCNKNKHKVDKKSYEPQRGLPTIAAVLPCVGVF